LAARLVLAPLGERRGAGREPTAAARRPTTQATLPVGDPRRRLPVCRGERAAAYGARHFKKVDRDFAGARHEIPLHQDSHADYPVTVMCSVLKVSPPAIMLALAPGEPAICHQSRSRYDIKRVHTRRPRTLCSPRIHMIEGQGRGVEPGRIERLSAITVFAHHGAARRCGDDSATNSRSPRTCSIGTSSPPSPEPESALDITYIETDQRMGSIWPLS